MHKLVTASLLLVFIIALQTNAFAQNMNCKFKERTIGEVKSIKISDKTLLINGELEVQLQKTKVRCGNFGRQSRFDGLNAGYQVILESCTTEADFEGILIDSVKLKAAEIICIKE